MKYDVITIFDTCVDLIVNLGDTIPEFDQKERWVDSFAVEMGGSNCIFACQSAKLGLKTTGAGVIGSDAFGKVVADGLLASGVDISHIKTDENLSTALGVLLTRKDDRAILTYSGTIGAADSTLITDSLLCSARHLHVGSYYLFSGLLHDFPNILKRAKDFGLTVSFDTNWDPSEKWILPEELLKYVDMFFPNENEAMFLTGKNNVKDAAFELSKKIPIVAVKQGAEGGMVISGEQHIKRCPPKVQVVDTVGAGDSFNAGFVYAYLHGLELESCLNAGIYCGSMNTTRTGGTAGQVSLDELQKYLC